MKRVKEMQAGTVLARGWAALERECVRMGSESLRIAPKVLIRSHSRSDSQEFAFPPSPASRRDIHPLWRSMRVYKAPGRRKNDPGRRWVVLPAALDGRP
jgi:hypothetical protein